MNFLIDAQLPPALARWISSQGHPATHVFGVGLPTADDPVIWERARHDRAVIISKDEDFVDRWLLIPMRFQDETNSGRVSAWQDPVGLIHSSSSARS